MSCQLFDCALKNLNQYFTDGAVGLFDMFKKSQEKVLIINFLEPKIIKVQLI